MVESLVKVFKITNKTRERLVIIGCALAAYFFMTAVGAWADGCLTVGKFICGAVGLLYGGAFVIANE